MSANETTENFWQVWNNFKWPDQPPVTFRCYYLDDGSVDFYTMEQLPGNYIEVTQEVYIRAPKPARVVNNQLVIPVPKITVHRLTPGHATGTNCHPDDVSIVVEHNGIVWNKEENEIN